MSIPFSSSPFVNPSTGTFSFDPSSPNIDSPLERDSKVQAIIQDKARSPEERIGLVNTYLGIQGAPTLLQSDLLRRIQEATPTVTTAQNAVVAAAPPSATEVEVETVVGNEIVVTAKRERPDHRVRLSSFPSEEAKLQVYGPNDPTRNILSPLYATDGLVFPYTPTVSVAQDTSWQTADLEHSNYDILSYQKSSSATFSISGKFTVQNQREGEYLLAALHFLRTVSKAYFGNQDVEQFIAPEVTQDTEQQVRTTRVEGKAGLPPPVLLFSGYGNMMFNDIRVVVKSHSWSFDEGQDLIRINLPNDFEVWLPPLMSVSITLGMQMNTDYLRDEFKLDEFRTGELLLKKGWF